MNNPLNKIQQQPYETRVKILWSVVALVAIGLLFLMINSIRNTIANADGTLIQIEAAKYVPQSSVDYVAVESVEQNDKSVKIYFNLNNPGTDILNVPKLSNITFNYGSTVVHPQKLTDRQGNPFVQKVLSHTQNFGIMIFPSITGQKGSLVFDQMYLEQAPNDVFQQKLWLDLNQLSKVPKVRN